METKEILDGPIKETKKSDKNKIGAYMKSLLKKIDFDKLLFVLLFFFVCYVISELLNGEEVMFIKMFSPSSTWAKRIDNIFITLDNFFMFPKFIVNYLMFIFAYWILYGVSNRTKLACSVIVIITFIFGVLNYVITDLRGVAITISDIYSIETAANVIKGVKLNVEGNFIVATVLFIVSLFIMFKCVKIKEKREDKTRTAKMITIILGVFGMITLFVPNYFTDEVEMWDVNRAYAHSGVGLTIARMVKDLKVKKPNQYTTESVQSILAKYSDDTEKITDSNDYPNIVVIMDESFADLPMTYSIDLNDDPIPYYHQLINGDNIISGIMHSSQFGGGTANVEYEFLTQNVTAFLPPGAMPYQQYITSDVKQSIVAYMNKLGYKTYGMHSWDKSGYSREKIYMYLGFYNSMFKDSIPQLRHSIGEYPTDESLFEAYYNIMNNKEKRDKNFSFIITMQNHMPYVYQDKNAQQYVPENDAAISYFQFEFQSDKALEQFIEYLKKYDEKTIVLFFGDHQPNINQDYWYSIVDGYDDITASHIVPFFIWANYDIKGQKGIETSPNYLESMLLEAANMPKDSYTKYIEELREELPVITNLYCIDKDGNRYEINDENSPYYDKLQEYWKMIYYNMFNK